MNGVGETAARILGVDPGLNITGYAVIERRLGRLALVEAGLIRGRSDHGRGGRGIVGAGGARDLAVAGADDQGLPRARARRRGVGPADVLAGLQGAVAVDVLGLGRVLQDAAVGAVEQLAARRVGVLGDLAQVEVEQIARVVAEHHG